MDYKQFLLNELKKVKSFNDIKYVDKRLSIPAGILIVVLLLTYYYFIFLIYPQQTRAARLKAAQEAAKTVPAAASVHKTDVENVETTVQPSTSDSRMQIYKIPRTHMDVSSIPPDDIVLYTDAFNTLFSYFDNINQGNYEYAINCLDKNFVASTNLSDALFKQYCKDTYYRYNNFYIESVTRNTDSTYTVKFSIRNNATDNVGFFTTFTLVKNNVGLSLVIDDIPKYINSKNLSNSKKNSN